MLILAEGAVWLSVVSAASGLIGAAIGASGSIYLAQIKIKADRRAERFRVIRDGYAKLSGSVFSMTEKASAIGSIRDARARLEKAQIPPAELERGLDSLRLEHEREVAAFRVALDEATKNLATVRLVDWNHDRVNSMEKCISSTRQVFTDSEYKRTSIQYLVPELTLALQAALSEVGLSLRREEDADDLD